MGSLVAIANAVTVSLQDVLIKKLRGENTFFVIWLRLVAALPILALAVWIFSAWAVPPANFWRIILLVNVPVEIFQFYVGYSAIQRSPLSLMAPLAASTSIFLVPVGYAILGEAPTIAGLVGILSIVAGAFVLGWRIGETRTLAESIRNLFREPGTALILAGSFLVAISISTAKLVFRYASPFLTAFYLTAAIATALIPLAFPLRPTRLASRVERPGERRPTVLPAAGRAPLFAGLAVLSGLSLGLHYTGLSLLPAAYYISIKRVSMLFNVLNGRFFFREEHIRERLAGALLMVAGVVIVALA